VVSHDASHAEAGSTGADVRERLTGFATEFDRRFDGFLSPGREVPPVLLEAVRYSALAPGKRLRPYLVVRCCELVGGFRDSAWPVAVAVECVHAFSLIHDDLPGMDDDDFRRGQAASHKEFGQAVAILAGDALVVLAFELLGRHVDNRSLAAEMMLELARATGWSGMIGGQAADIVGEAKPPQLELAQYIHERKTAALFEASCKLGAMAGSADSEEVIRLGRFGRMLGQAFQIADDLLDIASSREVMGKEAGKDAVAGKQSFPRCVGIEQSRLVGRQAVNAALSELGPFGADVDDLRSFADYILDRKY
jgi:geranylgeranyl diphosphate synthase type II